MTWLARLARHTTLINHNSKFDAVKQKKQVHGLQLKKNNYNKKTAAATVEENETIGTEPDRLTVLESHEDVGLASLNSLLLSICMEIFSNSVHIHIKKTYILLMIQPHLLTIKGDGIEALRQVLKCIGIVKSGSRGTSSRGRRWSSNR